RGNEQSATEQARGEHRLGQSRGRFEAGRGRRRELRMSPHKRQSGFSLVEVLVAMLIVSIGLLGIVALQSLALTNTGSSMERSQAVIQTYSYMEFLRANREQAIISNLDIPLTCDPENLPESQVEQRRWITQLH